MNRSRIVAVVAIVATNSVPLIGVVAFGWSPAALLLMYWIEAGVVGLVNVARIRIARVSATAGWVLPIGWLAAYAVFWAILGMFVVEIVSGDFYKGASATGFSGVALDQVVVGTIALLAGQLLAFVFGYLRDGRNRTITSVELLRDPFVRIMVLVGVIALGGVGTAIAGSAVGFTAVIVIVKTGAEAWYAGRPQS